MKVKLKPKIGDIYHWESWNFNDTIMIISQRLNNGEYEAISEIDTKHDEVLQMDTGWFIFPSELIPYTKSEINAAKKLYK
jgi:hypothetical protein